MRFFCISNAFKRSLLKKFFFYIVFLYLATNVFSQDRNTILNQKYQETLALLSKLSDNNVIWSGQAGADCIRRMNRALKNATNLRIASDMFTYKAASTLTDGISEEQFIALCGGKNVGVTYTGKYTDAMQLLELGMFPEMIIAILKLVKIAEAKDSYVARLKEMLNLTNNEATSLAWIIKNQEDFLNNPIFSAFADDDEGQQGKKGTQEETTFLQSYKNGMNDLEFGTTLEKFLSEYEDFHEGSAGTDLKNIGVSTYLRRIDVMRGQAIWVHFFEDRFYKADAWQGYMNNTEIDNIFRDIVSTYGKISRADEGRTNSDYYWFLNDNFVIHANISLSDKSYYGRRMILKISYIEPQIEKRINNLLQRNK